MKDVKTSISDIRPGDIVIWNRGKNIARVALVLHIKYDRVTVLFNSKIITAAGYLYFYKVI